jgi:hypothetical protein
MKLLGYGKYGKVYMGCYNKKCHYKYAVKSGKGLEHEYKVLKLLHPLEPKHIPEPHKFLKVNSGELLLQQYLDLKNFFDKSVNHKKVLKKVLNTLLKIQKKFPSFRHNDLSYKNIFITKDDGVFIGDFGLSNLNRDGYRNPLIMTERFKKYYGTFPKNSKMFDTHFLLNSMYVDGPPHVKKYIETLLPSNYLGVRSDVILNGRLRWNVDHKNLPTTRQIFSSIKINE